MSFYKTKKYLLIIFILLLLLSGCTNKKIIDKDNLSSNKSMITDRYLGLENGKVSLTDMELDEYAKLLGLKPEYGTIWKFIKAGILYFVFDTNMNLYSSCDLKKWNLANVKVSKCEPTLFYDNNKFILYFDKKLYQSADGINFTAGAEMSKEQWHEIIDAEENSRYGNLPKKAEASSEIALPQKIKDFFIKVKGGEIYGPEGYSSLDKGYLSELYKEKGFSNDMLMLQDFIVNYNIADYDMENVYNEFAYVDDTLFLIGKYGGIIRINPNLSLDWVGLYPRIPLTDKEMRDSNIGGRLGIVEKDGMLYYANSFLLDIDSFYNIYKSKDGKLWTFDRSHKGSTVKLEGMTYTDSDLLKQEYLGTGNGSISMTNKNISTYAKYLNLDSKMPAVMHLDFAGGIYMAATSDNCLYTSKDLVNWKKSNMKLKDVRKAKLIAGKQSGFLIFDDNEYYFSKDGKKKELIKGLSKYIKPNSEIIFTDNHIYTYKRKYKTNDSKKFNKFTAFRCNEVEGVSFDGTIFLGTRGMYHVLYSKDGIRWNKVSKKGVLDVAYASTFSIPKVDKQKLFLITQTYEHAKSDFAYVTYKITNNDVILEKVDKRKVLGKNKDSFIYLLTQLLNYEYIQADAPTLGGRSDVFRENKFQGDMVALQDFICHYNENEPIKNQHISYKIMNHKLYYFGKYGGIIEIDDQLNHKWVGLYQRTPLDKKEINDSTIGGKIGFVNKDGTLWYSNTFSKDRNSKYNVYASDDGESWVFKFSMENVKIPIKILDKTLGIRR